MQHKLKARIKSKLQAKNQLKPKKSSTLKVELKVVNDR